MIKEDRKFYEKNIEWKGYSNIKETINKGTSNKN
jgi:hypothetical protein